MPAVTGAFYAAHVDNAELNCRPSRLFEIHGAGRAHEPRRPDRRIGRMGQSRQHHMAERHRLRDPGRDHGLRRSAAPSPGTFRRTRSAGNSIRCARSGTAGSARSPRSPPSGSGPSRQPSAGSTRRAASLQGASPAAALAEAENYEEVLRLVNAIPPAVAGPPMQAGGTMTRRGQRLSPSIRDRRHTPLPAAAGGGCSAGSTLPGRTAPIALAAAHFPPGRRCYGSGSINRGAL